MTDLLFFPSDKNRRVEEYRNSSSVVLNYHYLKREILKREFKKVRECVERFVKFGETEQDARLFSGPESNLEERFASKFELTNTET